MRHFTVQPKHLRKVTAADELSSTASIKFYTRINDDTGYTDSIAQQLDAQGVEVTDILEVQGEYDSADQPDEYSTVIVQNGDKVYIGHCANCSELSIDTGL